MSMKFVDLEMPNPFSLRLSCPAKFADPASPGNFCFHFVFPSSGKIFSLVIYYTMFEN